MKKTFKSVEEQLLKKGVLKIVPDPDYMVSYKERIDAKNKAFREAKEAEEQRIAAIQCPTCKSTDKEHIIKSDSNGVCGPGYHSWIIDEYFVCNECGTMFKDLSKLKKK
jgi:transposase-like protein